jgi:hypothetical protein
MQLNKKLDSTNKQLFVNFDLFREEKMKIRRMIWINKEII